MKPVSARLPVSSISRSSPTRSSISAHSAAGALVVPEDRRPQHLALRVERDEAVHLARKPDRARREPREHACVARHQSSGSCSDHPGCGVESG